MSIFITGTDTNHGKTIIASWICIHTQYAYWKPIQCGVPGDRDFIQKITDVQTYPETYRFKDHVAPHAASKLAGIPINFNSIHLPAQKNLVIEGAGGVLVPLTEDHCMIDLMKKWQIPVLIVARSTLGTINHTCLTIEALQHRSIPIAGVVLNGPLNLSNKQAIEDYGRCPVLAEFTFLQEVSAKTLQAIPVPPKLKAAL